MTACTFAFLNSSEKLSNYQQRKLTIHTYSNVTFTGQAWVNNYIWTSKWGMDPLKLQYAFCCFYTKCRQLRWHFSWHKNLGSKWSLHSNSTISTLFPMSALWHLVEQTRCLGTWPRTLFPVPDIPAHPPRALWWRSVGTERKRNTGYQNKRLHQKKHWTN